jgi:uncharacterized protein YjdB
MIMVESGMKKKINMEIIAIFLLIFLSSIWSKEITLVYGASQAVEAESMQEDANESTVVSGAEMILEETTNLQEKSTEIVPLTDIDLGDYQTKMIVGETQLLSVTSIPTNATDSNMTFSSSNVEIATINGLGRIKAIKEGTTQISVNCGDVIQSFVLAVVAEDADKVGVTDIEIADHDTEVNVGKTLILSGTVVPSNATETTISFRSSDSNIATVTSQGEVKGINKGNVMIYCSAGGITKEIPISVKVATTKLTINNNYLVLKQGARFSLQTTVTPEDAEQNITYESQDNEIASVSADGVVTAKKCGNTNIIVSNGDATIAVSVIVNMDATEVKITDEGLPTEAKEQYYSSEFYAEREPYISMEILKYLYKNQEILTIFGKGYQVQIHGDEIKNYTNEFRTDIELSEEDDGYSFVINDKKPLCGSIHLFLDDASWNYLYLYNESKQRYEMIQVEQQQELILTTAGKYLIAKHKMANQKMGAIIPAGAGGILLVLCIIYISVKKRYWFW